MSDSTPQQTMMQFGHCGANDLPIQWNYYQLTHPSGRRLAFVFTLEADLVDKFRQIDEQLVLATKFTDPTITAAQPTLRLK